MFSIILTRGPNAPSAATTMTHRRSSSRLKGRKRMASLNASNPPPLHQAQIPEGHRRDCDDAPRLMEESDEKLLETFKNDVARFSGNYLEFLIVVKRKDGNLSWKSSDVTWATGAATRYLSSIDEMDRYDERKMQE